MSDFDAADQALAEKAKALLRDPESHASVSYLQRKLGVGYNEAARAMEQLQLQGLVSAPGDGGRRKKLF